MFWHKKNIFIFSLHWTSLKSLRWKLWLLDQLVNSTIHNKIRNLPGTEWKLTVLFLSPDVWWVTSGRNAHSLTLSKMQRSVWSLSKMYYQAVAWHPISMCECYNKDRISWFLLLKGWHQISAGVGLWTSV